MSAQSLPPGEKLGPMPVIESKGFDPITEEIEKGEKGSGCLHGTGLDTSCRNHETLTATERGKGDEAEKVLPGEADIENSQVGGMSDEAEEESLEARIERLGRERPQQFKTLWAEIVFVFSISMSQVLSVSFVSKDS